MPLIAPSLLASDFLHLADACQMLNESEASWFHLDVMDGRFVPNISYGISIIQQIRKTTKKICDVHLMIMEPEKFVESFKTVGADNITVHLEACTNLHRNIEQIKSMGISAGVAINPHSPVCLLQDILPYVDLVLVMSVNPGFGGQTFIPQTLVKIRKLKEMIMEGNYPVKIQVDGGITLDNAKSIVEAGADVLVAGSTIFLSKNPKQTILNLKQL